MQVLIRAETLSLETSQLWYLPEIQRLQAETLIQLEQYAAAHDSYLKAWTAAAMIGADFWQLKIASSMAENKILTKNSENTHTLFADAARFLNENGSEAVTGKTRESFYKSTSGPT